MTCRVEFPFVTLFDVSAHLLLSLSPSLSLSVFLSPLSVCLTFLVFIYSLISISLSVLALYLSLVSYFIPYYLWQIYAPISHLF